MEFLSPDVYVEEVQGKNGQIVAPSTSTFAMAGYSPRGPEGKAYVHGSLKEFLDRFGGFSSKSMNAYVATAFFSEGGSQFVFVRALHDDATFASGSFAGHWDVKASGRGVWANNAVITFSGNENFYNRTTGGYDKFDLTVELIDPSTGLLTATEKFETLELTDTESPDYAVKVVEASSEDIKLTANTGGVPTQLQPTPFTALAIGSGDGSTTAFTANLASQAPLAETTLKIKVNGVVVAQDDGNGAIAGTGITGTVNYVTGAVAFSASPAPASGATITADVIKKGASSVAITLLGGLDGSTVIASDVVGSQLQATGAGIYALDTLPIQMSLALPDFAGDSATDKAMISYCAKRADMVALIQPPKGSSSQVAANYKRNVLASTSSYAAMYWPWINIPDTLNKNRPKLIPPCGHVAGRFAYTDSRENVGKAPAGVTRGQLSYFISLERDVSLNDQKVVYQAQINPLRSDANVGTAIWGNKTLQVVGDFVEVNVRRTFIFLEKAQYAGLLDIVFENIGPVTFGLVKARLDAFLENQYLQGVIGSGVTDKAQAFKVVCDASNNPPAVQQQKRLVIDEFIKPNLAAEFIHLRLQRVFDASQA